MAISRGGQTMKLIDGQKELQVPEEVAKYLLESGHKNKDKVTLNEYDQIVLSKPPKGAVKKSVDEFDAELAKAANATAPLTEQQEPKAGAVSDAVQTVDVFAGGGFEEAIKEEEDKAKEKPARAPKTKAEKEEALRQKLLDENEAKESIKREHDQIGKLRAQLGGIENGKEALLAIRRLFLLNGNLPYFRTLTPSDTRLKASVEDTVPKNARVRHPALEGSPTTTGENAIIPLSESLGEYKIVWKENNLPQPKGFFVYVPENLTSFDPSLVSFAHTREQVIDAEKEYEGMASEDIPRVIKYYSKKNLLTLLLILDAPMRRYDEDSKSYVLNSEIIIAADTNSKRAKSTSTLRAKDHNGVNIKLSVRNFIPLQTYDTIIRSKADFYLTTQAFFKRSLFTEAANRTGMKFDQLLEPYALKFVKDENGNLVYTDFQSSMDVLRYDNPRGREDTINMELPHVVESSSGRAVFKKSKNEPTSNYKAIYKPDYDRVGAEINASRAQTVKAGKAVAESQRRSMENIIGIFTDSTFLG